MIKKALLLLMSIVMLTAVVAGCWNYVDVDTQFVVMGVVIDYDVNTEEYILHAEVAKAKGGSNTELITRVESFRGATLFDATRNAIMVIGAKLYWGHTMVYVISEKVARMGVADVMSLLSRQTQIRSDIFIIVCDDESVQGFFEFNDPIHESVSQHVYDLLMTYKSSGKFLNSPLFKVLQDLGSEEVSLMLPYLKIKEDKEDQESGESSEQGKEAEEESKGEEKQEEGGSKPSIEEILVVEGSVVFRADKKVGKFSEIETRSALIITGRIDKNYVVTHEEDGDIPTFTIEVMNSKVSIEPEMTEDEKLKVKVDIELEGDLVELQTLEDFITDEKKGELEKAFVEMVEQELLTTLKKGQELGSDVFGIAGVVHRKMKKEYKELEGNWDEVYKGAEFDVKAELVISSSSLSMNPVKVGR